MYDRNTLGSTVPRCVLLNRTLPLFGLFFLFYFEDSIVYFVVCLHTSCSSVPLHPCYPDGLHLFLIYLLSPMCISVCIPHGVSLSVTQSGSISLLCVLFRCFYLLLFFGVFFEFYFGFWFWFLPNFVIVNYVKTFFLTYVFVCASAACAQVLLLVKNLNWRKNNETQINKSVGNKNYET